MSVYKVIFSPTGGTERIADILVQELNTPYETIDLSKQDKGGADGREEREFAKEDICLVGVPVFGGRVPKTAVQRLKKLSGNGTMAVLLVVYGNRAYEDALTELRDIVQERGFFPVAGIAAVAEHSIIRGIGSGRPDKNDAERLRIFASEIEQILKNVKDKRDIKSYALDVPGKQPYRTYSPLPIDIFTDEGCGKCGICAEKCPVGAIDKNNPSAKPGDECISCMRCISVCPDGLKHADGEKVKFLNSRISKVCEGRKECELYRVKF